MSVLIRTAPGTILLVLLGISAFGIQLGGEFLWDDTLLVVENLLTGDWRNLPRFFTVPLWETTPVVRPDQRFYRPLMLVDLWLDRALISPPAAWLHRLHNLLWHLTGVVLLQALLKRLRPGAWLAFPAAALYALHPLQTEVVAFTAARNDAMASTLMLGCLLALLPPRVSRARLAGGALLFGAALLSKEVAIATPLLLLGLDRLLRGRPVGGARHAVLWGLLGLWGVLRLGLGMEDGLALPPDLLTWAAHSAQILLAPGTTSPTAYLDAVSPVWWGLPLLGGTLATIALVGGAQARLGLLWALFTLLPCLPAVAGTDQMPYRYLTVPLAGLAVAVHGAWPDRRPSWIGVALALGLTVATLTSASQWHDATALWLRGWQLGPSPRSACGVFKAMQETDEAEPWLQRALAPPPAQYCCFSATSYHLNRGRPDEAVLSGRLALENGCISSPELLAPLSMAEAATGNWLSAEKHAKAALPDPTGLAPIVLSATALRRGDSTVLEEWEREGHAGEARPLREQVQWLLEVGGP